jgi:hypothetical protein
MISQERQIQDIHDKVNRLYTAVCGDECLGVEGTIKKVDRHERYIENDKKMKWTIAGGVAVISSALAAIWTKIF